MLLNPFSSFIESQLKPIQSLDRHLRKVFAVEHELDLALAWMGV